MSKAALYFYNPPTLGTMRRALTSELTPKYGAGEAAAMARIILQDLKGWSLEQLIANEDRNASDYIINRSREILNQLLRDVPLQYALGKTIFYGLTLKVGPGVLIPRPETAELVDIIVRENPESDLNVLDLCTGSGAIALALARNLRFPTVTAIDIDPEALTYARTNATELKARVSLLQKDIFKATFPSETFEIIVSNPPYIGLSEMKDMKPNVVDHEPHRALFVPDQSPLIFYECIADIAASSLTAGGRLYLEINPLHALDLVALLAAKGLTDIEIIKDIHGSDRFIKARKEK